MQMYPPRSYEHFFSSFQLAYCNAFPIITIKSYCYTVYLVRVYFVVLLDNIEIAHMMAYPKLNSHLQRHLQRAIQVCSVHSRDDMVDGRVGRSDFDSHANMIVIGKDCYIISRSGRFAEVNAFSQEVGRMESVPIIDAAVAYDCPNTGTMYILIARNVLYVPSMTHNLIPPFILREAGIVVNDTAKIHIIDPTPEDHSVFFPKVNL